MEKRFFFNILIICVIAVLEIHALAEENDNDILVRKKRIIDYSLFPNIINNISQVPYIVNILKNNSSFCGAAILASNIVITAAYCVFDDDAEYTILSGSIYRRGGIEHHITIKKIHYGYNPIHMSHNVALLVIQPPIDLLHSYNEKIDLFNPLEAISPESTLSGWGCIHLESGQAVYPSTLRSTTVPIISLVECRKAYHGYDQVADYEFCTHDSTGQKRSCYGDVGGPLVNKNKLLGIMSWTRVVPNRISPDVYVNLLSPPFRGWINLFLHQYQHGKK